MTTARIYCLGIDFHITQYCLKNNKLIRKDFTIRENKGENIKDLLIKTDSDRYCLFEVTNDCGLTTFWSRESGVDKLIRKKSYR